MKQEGPADDFDYAAECDKLILAARFMADLDLTSIIQISMAHTLGPIVDPTKYRDALHLESLDDIGRLADAAAEVKKAFHKLPTEDQLAERQAALDTLHRTLMGAG